MRRRSALPSSLPTTACLDGPALWPRAGITCSNSECRRDEEGRVPIAITEEQLALQASIREWAKRARPIAQVRRLEPGAPPAGARGSPAGGPSVPAARRNAAECWNDVADLGIFSIGLPADAGGAGGTVADLAAALEEITCALVPGPVMPTLLAGLALAGHADIPGVKALLPALAAGQAAVAVGLTTGTVSVAWASGGKLRVTGQAGPVLGGGSTAQLDLGAVMD